MSRKKGVILSYILMFFEVISTLLLTPFIIRILGQAEYGVYKLSAALSAYLLLLDLGIGNAITRYIAKFKVDNNKEKEEQFLGVATVFYLFISCISIVIGLILYFLFPSTFSKGLNSSEIHLGQQLLFVTTLNIAITLATSAYTNTILAYEKFTISKGANIIQIIFRTILTYIALLIGFRSLGIVIINFITTLICRSFYIIYVLYFIKLKPIFKNIDKSFIKEVFSYSFLIFLQMIATQLNSSIDQILIGMLVSSSAIILAVYGIGTQLVQYFQQIGLAFTNVLMPGIVKLVEKKSSATELMNEMIRIGRIILIVLGLIWTGFCLLGKQFIVLWAGALNENAYYVAIILMSAYVLILTESVGTQVLWAMNKHKEQSFLKILIVLLNIILTIILIKWDPLIGATMGTFISLILGDIIVMNIVFIKHIKINIYLYYKNLFKGIIPTVIITYIIGYLCISLIGVYNWLSIIILGIIISFIYILNLLLFGMNKYEKELVFSIFKRNEIKK